MALLDAQNYSAVKLAILSLFWPAKNEGSEEKQVFCPADDLSKTLKSYTAK